MNAMPDFSDDFDRVDHVASASAPARARGSQDARSGGAEDPLAPRWAALFSLTLLATSGSRCYAEDEVRGWLAEARFVDVREAVVDTEPWDPNRVLLATRV